MTGRKPSPLRKARQARGWSIQTLSERSNVSHAIIQSTEVRRTRPPFLVQKKLADALHIAFPVLWPERMMEFQELRKLINGTPRPKDSAPASGNDPKA